MNIRFTSSLTPNDENQLAPAILAAMSAVLDLLPIAYAIRIDTTGTKVFHHTGRCAVPDVDVETRRAAVHGNGLLTGGRED